jgi:starch synthase
MNINAHEFLFATRYACDVYRHAPDAWQKLVSHAMQGDYSWDHSAASYIKLYQAVRS